MRIPSVSARASLFLALLSLAVLACGLGDIFGSSATGQPPVQGSSNPAPTCRPATTAAQVADILYDAQLNEHKQPGISINIFYTQSSQTVTFVKPDRFLWSTSDSSHANWEEVRFIGGTVYLSSNGTSGWTTAPLLDPALAAMMQAFIDLPTKLSETDIKNQLAASGVVNVKFDGYLIAEVPDFGVSCLYDIRAKSGGTIIYSQQTWIDPGPWLRLKFQARDETGNITETRFWEYDDVQITAP